MKQTCQSCALILFLLFLVTFFKLPANLMATKEGVSHLEVEDDVSLDKLMGLEVCENGDEECLKKRIVSEVHLDYIYTQHHRP
ncbi:hypothetical protein Nepgr_014002 [Nepenthes gracilis]|uniref:Phytosulfokine n=1 Tax=Nepenthes gracilis TaxID=150966 RepID=A0AAD3SKS1_NEPGR|nr:hypothetical protein Nepgr_014002 [Nepenthes gracilis]